MDSTNATVTGGAPIAATKGYLKMSLTIPMDKNALNTSSYVFVYQPGDIITLSPFDSTTSPASYTYTSATPDSAGAGVGGSNNATGVVGAFTVQRASFLEKRPVYHPWTCKVACASTMIVSVTATTAKNRSSAQAIFYVPVNDILCDSAPTLKTGATVTKTLITQNNYSELQNILTPSSIRSPILVDATTNLYLRAGASGTAAEISPKSGAGQLIHANDMLFAALCPNVYTTTSVSSNQWIQCFTTVRHMGNHGKLIGFVRDAGLQIASPMPTKDVHDIEWEVRSIENGKIYMVSSISTVQGTHDKVYRNSALYGGCGIPDQIVEVPISLGR